MLLRYIFCETWGGRACSYCE